MNIYERAKQWLSLDTYEKADPAPEFLHYSPLPDYPLRPPSPRQYILRMPVLTPWSHILFVPPELKWLEPHIRLCRAHHDTLFPEHPFIYVTVRHGVCSSTTDDEWHVDGFSYRKRHVPEQNYIYSNVYRTQWLDHKFRIPQDFNPLKHNIQQFFTDSYHDSGGDDDRNREFGPGWNIIDPYIVHRRPRIAQNRVRTMIRISFVPIEIEDDNYTQNSLIYAKQYGGVNKFRETLVRYTV